VRAALRRSGVLRRRRPAGEPLQARRVRGHPLQGRLVRGRGARQHARLRRRGALLGHVRGQRGGDSVTRRASLVGASLLLLVMAQGAGCGESAVIVGVGGGPPPEPPVKDTAVGGSAGGCPFSQGVSLTSCTPEATSCP